MGLMLRDDEAFQRPSSSPFEYYLLSSTVLVFGNVYLGQGRRTRARGDLKPANIEWLSPL